MKKHTLALAAVAVFASLALVVFWSFLRTPQAHADGDSPAPPPAASLPASTESSRAEEPIPGEEIVVEHVSEHTIELSSEQEREFEQLSPEERNARIMELIGPQIHAQLLEEIAKLPPKAREEALRALNGQDVEGTEVRVEIAE